MSDKYKKLFQKLEQFEPSGKLRSKILEGIDFENKHYARIRLVFLGTIAAASLAGLIPSFQYASREFSQSGFYHYFSLIFSDSDTVLSSWKAFILSLAETIPAMEMTIFLIVFFIFLVTAKMASKNFYRINYKLI